MGYFDKMDEQANMFRIASWRIHQSLVGKDALTIEKYWPLRNDKPIEKITKVNVSPDMWEQIKKAHNLNINE